MAKLKLTYFDFHGGRGEPARLALSIGGIPFEDDRVPPAEWERRKAHTPFGALPVLERDGQVVAQSNAINLCGQACGSLPVRPMASRAVRRGDGGRGGHRHKDWSYLFPTGRTEKGSARRAGRRPHPLLSRPARAAARSTWGPVLRRRSAISGGSQSLRVDPTP